MVTPLHLRGVVLPGDAERDIWVDPSGRISDEPVPDAQSFVYTLRFPPQEHKIGGRCVDPRDGEELPRAGRRRTRPAHTAPREKALGGLPLCRRRAAAAGSRSGD